MTVRVIDISDGFTSSSAPSDLGAFVVSANQAIGSGGTITLGNGANQLLKVSGSGGAQTASTTPFGATPPENGTTIMLMGTDSTNTIQISHNDAADGCILNGDAILGEYDTLTLVYESATDRYIEQTRNF